MVIYFVIIGLLIAFGQYAQVNIRAIEVNGKTEYNRAGKFGIFMCAAVLIFVSSFRYKMGTDYGNYARAYLRYCENWLTYIKEFDEPGIGVLIKFSSLFYDDKLSMFIICSIVTIALYIYTIRKYSPSFVFSVLLYVFVGSWHGSFNAMRQYLAAAILFVGHRYLYDRKLLKYLLVVFLATAFHKTAVVMLPVYFLVGRKISLKNITLCILMVIAIRYGYDFLFSTMSFLKGSDQSEYAYMRQEVNILRVAVSLVPVFLIVFVSRTRAFTNRDTQFYCMMLIVNTCFMFATQGSAYLNRGAIYTETYIALALPRMMDGFDRKTQRILMLTTLFLYGGFWLYELYSRDMIPFMWIFNQ